jgi:hypothetical protein
MFKTFSIALMTAAVSASNACVADPGTLNYWCIEPTAHCSVGFPITTKVCADTTMTCCEHYCMEGEENCVEALPPIKAAPEFLHGFLMEYVKVNNLSEVATCVDNFHTDFADVDTIIADLKNKDIAGAIAEL